MHWPFKFQPTVNFYVDNILNCFIDITRLVFKSYRIFSCSKSIFPQFQLQHRQ
jgi:hypothetical protein